MKQEEWTQAGTGAHAQAAAAALTHRQRLDTETLGVPVRTSTTPVLHM